VVFLYHSWDINPADLPSPSGYHINVFFALESPRNAPPNVSIDAYKQLPHDYFNLTLTYRHDSDLPWPYDAFEPYTLEDVKPGEYWPWEEVRDRVAKKKKLAVVFVSHCKTESLREEYLNALKQYIPVTEVGACSKNFCKGADCLTNELG